MEDRIKELYSKDNNQAYKTLLELEIQTTTSNELYIFFDEFLRMLTNERSFVRKRGFRMICSLSKWDVDNKIDSNIEQILLELDDSNGIAIRQSLAALPMILLYKTKLTEIIEKKLRQMDLSKYKESMQELIKKDIEAILKNI